MLYQLSEPLIFTLMVLQRLVWDFYKILNKVKTGEQDRNTT